MNRHVRIYLAGALVLSLLFTGFYFGLWRPRSAALARTRAAQAAVVAQKASLSAQLAQLRSAAKSISADRQIASRVTNAVPPKPALAQLIREVDSASKSSGFQFLSISPGEPQAAATSQGTGTSSGPAAPSQMSITLNGNGTFFQALDFLHQLAHLPRIFVVDTLSLAPGGSGGSSGSPSGTSTGGTSTGSSSSGSGTAVAPGTVPTLTVSIGGRVFTTYVAPAPGVAGTAAPAASGTGAKVG